MNLFTEYELEDVDWNNDQFFGFKNELLSAF
jgi:hypothetical protein